MKGLTSAEARERLARYGPNRVPEPPPRPWWRSFLEQFRHPLVHLLLAALAIDLTLWLTGREENPYQAALIAAILLVNAGISTWQEYRTERTLERLRDLVPTQVWVLRDGEWKALSPEALVPGDLVRLEAGDRVPADATLEAGEGVRLDESMLTGESVPVDKRPGEPLSAGTLVVQGLAFVRVTRTGAASALGRLATMVGEEEEVQTPLERRLEAFARTLAQAVLLLGLGLLLLGLWTWGPGRWAEVLLFAVALAVAAVPEGLPAMLALALALGSERMARRRALVRRLAVVEALGSVTLIATDKTGTLTENRLRVERLEASDLVEALRACWWASPSPADPVDRALLAYARERLPEPPRGRVLGHKPFDSRWAYTRVTVEQGGLRLSYLKGAPEVLLARSRLPEHERGRWEEAARALSEEGFKVLGLARAEGDREDDLTWLGLVALLDPPRPEVPGAIRAAQRAGVRVVMITGDHPATARKIAEQVGLRVRRVATSADLEGLSSSELVELARSVDVFARFRPEDKLRLVQAYREMGEVVGVTGDGVNDAPALKAADVGVAMGQRGSDVAKEAADLVLLDDNFATIVAAIEEGRNALSNIRNFLTLLFATNASEILVVVLGVVYLAFLGAAEAELPLTAGQILWINLVTDSFLALALAADRHRGLLERPPEPPGRPLLDAAQWRFITLAAAGIAAFVLALRFGPWEDVHARTLAFHLLVLAQAGTVFAVRRYAGAPRPNRWIALAVAAVVGAQVLAGSWPWLRRALALEPLARGEALWLLGMAALVAAAIYATARLVAPRRA